jgi:hypothetical protein
VAIRDTCRRHERPFSFLAGAGVSYPSPPLACSIVEDCKKEVAGLEPPADQPPMRAYA